MRRWAPLGIVLALALIGCGGQSEVSRGGVTIFVHGDSVLPRGGEDGLIEGALVVRDGCVLLEREGSKDAYPIVWPSGTSISKEDPLTLKLPSGDHLKVGQTVSGAGGTHDALSDQVEVDLDAKCLPGTNEVLVFNPDAELTVR